MRRLAWLALSLAALAPAQTKTVTVEDAKKFESLGATSISNDGNWVLAGATTTLGDPVQILQKVGGGPVARIDLARGGAFSDDSRWAAWTTAPSREDADRMRAEKKPVESKLTLRNLGSGTDRTFDNVSRFSFLKGGKTLLVQRPGGENGGDALFVDLASGRTMTLAGVVAVEPKPDGTAVALVVRTGGEDALEILDPRTMALRPVLYGKERLKALAWAAKADALALLQAKTDDKKEGDAHKVVLVRGDRIDTLEPTVANSVPEGYRISESAGVEISDDGASVAFGIAPWGEKKKPLKPGELPKPEIWTYRDIRTVPLQRVRLAADRSRTDVVVWRADAKIVRRLTDETTQEATLLGDFSKALVTDSKPYDSAVTNGFGYADTDLVDVATGARTRVVTQNHDPVLPSPKGKWLAFYEGGRWRLIDTATGKPHDPLAASKTDFGNDLDDHATPTLPPASYPVWLDGEAGMIVGDRYDQWIVQPSGARRLTDGRKARRTYRLADPEPYRDGPPPVDGPRWYSVMDEDTKASGYVRLDPSGRKLAEIFDNALIGGLRKARDADRMIYTKGTWQNSPSVVATDAAGMGATTVVVTNPQRAQFAWGKDELIAYKSRWGKPLQGVLIYPADYQPGKKYPMVTYLYERLSQNLHAFQAPNEGSPYSAQWLSQNGYFVLMPDIAYRRRSPGIDAVECIEPALDAALARNGDIDRDKIGLMGHSWGGYQTAFVSSVSKRFKVAVAGAPLTDLVAMSNTFYWNSGNPNGEILETSQGRLEVPFFDDPKAYLENSPIWRAKEMNTPLLMEFGDQDGAVDPHQPMALYMTLRRMGKPVWMLTYAGENHNNAKRGNQVDYAQRVRQFLDVYLKGATPPAWIKDGVPLVKRDD